MCVQNMECVYRIWNVCTDYGMCVQNMECVYSRGLPCVGGVKGIQHTPAKHSLSNGHCNTRSHVSPSIWVYSAGQTGTRTSVRVGHKNIYQK